MARPRPPIAYAFGRPHLGALVLLLFVLAQVSHLVVHARELAADHERSRPALCAATQDEPCQLCLIAGAPSHVVAPQLEATLSAICEREVRPCLQPVPPQPAGACLRGPPSIRV